MDPDWLDREVCLIIRNLQKYFYFHKRVICCISVLLFTLEFGKDGTFFGLQWKMVTVFVTLLWPRKKGDWGKKWGLCFSHFYSGS